MQFWEAAPAKINLFLHVTGRRADSYHLLESLVVFAGIGDVVRATPAPRFSLDISGPFARGLGNGPDNLVLRAALALRDASGGGAPMRLSLEKHLPIASGIGGGSADAAATLRLLARLWGFDGNLFEVAGRLGADVPVCLAGRPTRMLGIGERLGRAPALPALGLVLVNPGVTLSTQDVFARLSGAFSPPATLPAGWRDAAAMAHDLRGVRNDLTAPAQSLAPVIDEVVAAIEATPGCRLARMSGSGATCFGLFDTPEAARGAADTLERVGWWCWGGPTADIAEAGVAQ